MSNPVEVLDFEAWAGSGRGLLARPIMPNNVVALQANIASIEYEIYNVTDAAVVDSDSLVVADVMLAALSGPNTWSKDAIGYSFIWAAPGSLWSTANKTYRIIVTFTTVAPAKEFIKVWEVTTKNPRG